MVSNIKEEWITFVSTVTKCIRNRFCPKKSGKCIKPTKKNAFRILKNR